MTSMRDRVDVIIQGYRSFGLYLMTSCYSTKIKTKQVYESMCKCGISYEFICALGIMYKGRCL